MNRDADVGLLRRTPSPPARACQGAHPSAAHAPSTLPHVDHEDAFVVEVGPDQQRTGQQWARAILEATPGITPTARRSGWCALGLQVRCSTPDLALLVASSRLGLEREVLVKCQQRTLLVAAFVQLENPIARSAGRSRARTSIRPATPSQAGQPPAR